MKAACQPPGSAHNRLNDSTVRRFDISFSNRQQVRRVDLRLLRRVVRTLLGDLLQMRRAELGVCLVAAAEITWLNETFLRNAGSTDVIAFDYTEPTTLNAQSSREVRGEIFVGVHEAVEQARRYRTTWQTELVRYIVHGTLHLLGFDDCCSALRRRMKRAENDLLVQLGKQFSLRRLGAQAGKSRSESPASRFPPLP